MFTGSMFLMFLGFVAAGFVLWFLLEAINETGVRGRPLAYDPYKAMFWIALGATVFTFIMQFILPV